MRAHSQRVQERRLALTCNRQRTARMCALWLLGYQNNDTAVQKRPMACTAAHLWEKMASWIGSHSVSAAAASSTCCPSGCGCATSCCACCSACCCAVPAACALRGGGSSSRTSRVAVMRAMQRGSTTTVLMSSMRMAGPVIEAWHGGDFCLLDCCVKHKPRQHSRAVHP